MVIFCISVAGETISNHQRREAKSEELQTRGILLIPTLQLLPIPILYTTLPVIIISTTMHLPVV